MNTLHLKRNLVTIVSIIIGAIGISVPLATAITMAWYAFNYIEDFSTQILFGAVSVYFCYRGYLITRCALNKLIIMILLKVA